MTIAVSFIHIWPVRGLLHGDYCGLYFALYPGEVLRLLRTLASRLQIVFEIIYIDSKVSWNYSGLCRQIYPIGDYLDYDDVNATLMFQDIFFVKF